MYAYIHLYIVDGLEWNNHRGKTGEEKNATKKGKRVEGSCCSFETKIEYFQPIPTHHFNNGHGQIHAKRIIKIKPSSSHGWGSGQYVACPLPKLCHKRLANHHTREDGKLQWTCWDPNNNQKNIKKKGGKQIWSSLKRSTKTVAIDYCVADFDLGTSPPGIFRQFFSSRSPCPW